MFEAPKQLWCPVPEGDNFVGEHIFLAYLPAESEVCELDFSVVVEEDVGGLDVPVEDLVGVEVGDSVDELLEDALDFGDIEPAFDFEESCEVVVHILEDEEGGAFIQIAFVGAGENDFLEFDNIRMINLLQQSNL
jgi:hypothetical protein